MKIPGAQPPPAPAEQTGQGRPSRQPGEAWDVWKEILLSWTGGKQVVSQGKKKVQLDLPVATMLQFSRSVPVASNATGGQRDQREA